MVTVHRRGRALTLLITKNEAVIDFILTAFFCAPHWSEQAACTIHLSTNLTEAKAQSLQIELFAIPKHKTVDNS